MSYSLSYADIIWKDDVPCSTQFDDIYFSRDGGVDETQHVFIHGNNLTSRFQTAKDSFTIIETGFGTGLNFLITADLWLKTAPKNSRLHFISTEKYPLSPADIEKALLDLLHNSGYPGVKFEKKIDFENLYNQRFN